ncbi:MAG: PQQ-dependent sugar dehydrogenase [Myxococcales bacterium]|nr:hypothetical protein [Myxococcales bacterium]HIK83904.1 hypothetical protein [Myxococcales bacterium]
MRNWIVGIALFTIVGVAACSALLPDWMTIKGPILSSMFGGGIDAPSNATVQSRFHLAEGFEVQLFAEGLPNARFMRFSPGGDLIVSQPRVGRLVHVFRDLDGDGRSDGHKILIENLDRPHGFDFRDQQLYIGEGGAIARVGFLETGPDSIAVAGEPTRIVEGIPEGGNHWSRTLRFGPDDKIYLNVGSSCNVCEEEDPRRAAILRFNVDGSGAEIYASGLRNSVGFDWQPGTDQLFATDNGRDLLGDDYPPCELNRIERGGFYGFPVANGNRRPDPHFGEGQSDRIAASIPPSHSFQAHTAPLGMTFVRHPDAEESLRGAALVALHGSWNRSELSGYKVVSLHWEANGEIVERDFMTGFNFNDDVIGRPVDIIEGPDGSFYLSDDYAGAIYRIAPKGTLAGGPNTQLSRPAAAPLSNPLADLDAATLADKTARGATLFAGNACGTCHLAEIAEAGMVAKPLGGLAAKYTIDSLSHFLLTPTPPMPVVALSPDDRRALSIYLLSTYAN